MPTDPEPNAIKTTHPSPPITLITLSRPTRRNALDALTATKLHHALLAFDADPNARVAILHGAHGCFCAGYDLHTVGANGGSGRGLAVGEPGVGKGEVTQGPMGPTRLRLRKPLIAAVAGYAVAGGLELALLADLRVVEADATLGVFCRRWGVPLIDGGTVRLPAIVGLGRALDLILTGRPVGAEEALGMGLANRVVGKGKALEEAVKLAESLVGFPQGCMLADRKSVYEGVFDDKGWEEKMRGEFRGGLECLEAEGVEGAGRFSRGEGRGGKFAAKL